MGRRNDRDRRRQRRERAGQTTFLQGQDPDNPVVASLLEQIFTPSLLEGHCEVRDGRCTTHLIQLDASVPDRAWFVTGLVLDVHGEVVGDGIVAWENSHEEAGYRLVYLSGCRFLDNLNVARSQDLDYLIPALRRLL